MNNLSGKEYWEAAQVNQEASLYFIVRYCSELKQMDSTQYRIVFRRDLAQDESRSISENSTWGIRRRFEKGQHKMSTKRFLGYDTDEDGKLVVDKKQAVIVKRLYHEFLSGKTVDYIKRIFEREGVVNWDGSTKWQVTTLQSMLENEKYKGDAILQKSYTVDFLSKKRVQNQGEIQKFHIEDDHEAIIEPWVWECVQLEIERRKNIWRSKGSSLILIIQRRIRLLQRLSVGSAIRLFLAKVGGVVQGRHGRYGSVVSGIR